MSRSVGIEKIYAYPGTLSLDMVALAEARGVDPGHPLDDLWVESRSLNPVWEDPVTMAVNAARGLLAGEDPEQVELIIVGTESSVDYGKPISTWVQRFAGVGPNCRNFETKHACYGGTGGLMAAAHWVASGFNRGKKAVVVCADQSRMHLGKPWEFVLGAASTAMLISDRPEVLEFQLDKHGYWTNEISDTYRPTARDEVGHADTSLFGYLEAVEGAAEHFMSVAGEPDYEAFARHIYHVPFGAMTYRAHRAVVRRYLPQLPKREIKAHFERKSKPGLRYNRRIGGSYTSATFLAMMGTIASAGEALAPGDEITVFSYGSGSCAEFYPVRVGPRAREVVAAAKLDALLDARRQVSVDEYEAIERARAANIDLDTFSVDKSSPAGPDGHWAAAYEGKGLCVLDGVEHWERRYRLS
ncbi:hydroxymethylglutaryl-CoA synthase family protein [Pseudenhygromyxa sp. WMMC2535]|uniref:hydroxymethylglutaryl-CoA synthase family protein n=1 Tax=Pseudenhygromyxa sp. WMMC2535 TaxID=2712867 RepID=UPI001553C1C3|nr:hydroxymethylglutaryl-CoA synthase family protein [Pseudenhygromyxa sp. WMMC2535]NVB38686.1 hydroxymethylglutaryl-CoA synthase family protein [Pseudenhygromyxa sp. WMMC2535]